MIVLPDTDENEAAEVRRRVCSAASEVCMTTGTESVRLTCGTAQLRPGDTVEDLSVEADRVVLEVKQQRRDDPGDAAPVGGPDPR